MSILRRTSCLALLVGTIASSASAQIIQDFSCADFGTGCQNLIPSGAPGTSFGTMNPSFIIVPDLGAAAVVTDVNMSINISHTWRGDIRVFLAGPGTSFQDLFSDLGGSANDADNINITLDDEAATAVNGAPCSSTTMACTGTFIPENTALSVFDGINPSGNWQLSIVDASTGNTGALVSWSLHITLLDSDGDGVADGEDNCIDIENANQADDDGDGVGDACDVCPDFANDSQDDADSDGMGDDCDNCPTEANDDQADEDDDGRGTACDNCPNDANFSQKDQDGDGAGDACDSAPDDPNVIDNENENDNDNTTPTGPDAACGGCGAGTATAMILTMGILFSASRRRLKSSKAA